VNYDMQGLFKFGQSREDKLRRVSLKVNEAGITFVLQVQSQFPREKFLTLLILGSIRLLLKSFFDAGNLLLASVFNHSGHKHGKIMI
jgi:hypothetical protein